MNGVLHTIATQLLSQSLQLVPIFVVVWLVCLLLKRASAHWRYLLWLVVLAKCLVPGFLAVPASMLPAPVAALTQTTGASEPHVPPPPTAAVALAPQDGSAAKLAAPADAAPQPRFAGWHRPWRTTAALLWLAGVAVYLGVLVWRAVRFRAWLVRSRAPLPAADQERAMVLAQRLGLNWLPPLWLTDGVAQPFVWGLWRGGIYFPRSISGATPVDDNVLAHELAHVARGDVLVNTLRLVVRALFFFHPLVWWASRQARLEQEKACDEMSIAVLGVAATDYADAVLSSVCWTERLPAAQVAMAGSVGQLEERIRTMLHPGRRFWDKPSSVTWVSVAAFAVVALPLALAGGDGKEAGEPPANKDAPRIVRLEPADGARDVDPNMKEMVVVFDCDMNQDGYSWCGSGPSFPAAPDGKAAWRDARTCVLPLKLEPGHNYSLSINCSATSFRSVDGVPVKPYPVSFQTRGQSATDQTAEAGVPKVLRLEPANGAKDVDPDLKEMVVVFDRDMGKGMSWCGGGPSHPAANDDRKAQWRDARTCVLPITLEPGHTYSLSINCQSYRNFRSADGVPVRPYPVEFQTRGVDAAGKKAEATVPQIVSITPADGAENVDPNLKEMVVLFDRDMGKGMSWCGGGPSHPAANDDRKAQWRDARTCVLPIKLEPGHTYSLSINCQSYRNFRSAEGVPVKPHPVTFRTAAK